MRRRPVRSAGVDRRDQLIPFRVGIILGEISVQTRRHCFGVPRPHRGTRSIGLHARECCERPCTRRQRSRSPITRGVVAVHRARQVRVYRERRTRGGESGAGVEGLAVDQRDRDRPVAPSISM